MHLANYDYEREDVFPVPFFTWSCPFHEQWEKELIEIFYSYRDNVENNPTEVTPHLKHDMYESSLGFFEEHEDLPPSSSVKRFKEYIIESTSNIIRDLNKESWDYLKVQMKDKNFRWKTYLTESWFHITKTGGQHEYHNHPNCDFGFIYYFTDHEESEGGFNRFYDVRMGGTARYSLGNHWQVNSSNKQFKPVAGKCLMFPGYVYHDSSRYFGTKDRILFSCNISVHSPDVLNYMPDEIMREVVGRNEIK